MNIHPASHVSIQGSNLSLPSLSNSVNPACKAPQKCPHLCPSPHPPPLTWTPWRHPMGCQLHSILETAAHRGLTHHKADPVTPAHTLQSLLVARKRECTALRVAFLGFWLPRPLPPQSLVHLSRALPTPLYTRASSLLELLPALSPAWPAAVSSETLLLPTNPT